MTHHPSKALFVRFPALIALPRYPFRDNGSYTVAYLNTESFNQKNSSMSNDQYLLLAIQLFTVW